MMETRTQCFRVCAQASRRMPAPSSVSPLSQRLQQLLLARPGESVSIYDLQTELRRQGQGVSLDRLRVLLHDQSTFTALADDRFMLRADLGAPVMPSAPTRSETLFLSHLQAGRDDYVVVDLETTGTDPAHDQIIQIAAVHVCGRSIVTRHWYVHCPPERLAPALRRILHLTDDLVAEIAAAPPLEAVWPEVRALLGQRTLVAHNARFDLGFLQHFDPTLTNPVIDTMELALLLLPHLPAHRLGELAAALHIDVATLSLAHVQGLPAGYTLSADTLHNAITDTLLLQAVYATLLNTLALLPASTAALVAALLPELVGKTEPQPADLAPLLPATPVPQPRAAPPTAGAAEILDQLAARDGLVPRASQRAMLELVATALTDAGSLTVEAPTGTGKTLAYLIPAGWHALQSERRVAIATAFKHLQDQLCTEVERLRTILPIRVQVLKGAANYLCLRDLQAACDLVDAETPIARRYMLAFIAHWYAVTPLATLDESPYWLRQTFPSAADLLREVAVDQATCTEGRCSFYAHCPLFTAYRGAEHADVLVLNQALWLTAPANLPPIDALIIDEAHNLEDQATNALAQEVSEPSVRAQLQRLLVPGTRRGALQRVLDLKPDDDLRSTIHRLRQAVTQALRLLPELRATLAAFVVACDERQRPEHGARFRLQGPPERIFPTRWRTVRQALDQLWDVYLTPLIDGLHTVAANLASGNEVLWRTLTAVRDELITQRTRLREILHAQRRDHVTWLAVEHDAAGVTGSWGFHRAPIDVAPALAERYQTLRSVVLTSATLTTGPGDFGFFIERLGLRALPGTQVIRALPPALPYHERVLLGLPSYLTYTPAQATQQSYSEELAAELGWLYRFTGGRALTLFTARTRLEAVWARSAPMLEAHGIPALAQRAQASRQKLVEAFKDHGGAVLYGLKSFWEGVDIPGEALSFVVMEKLPYPAMHDPIHAARQQVIRERSGRDFQEYLFPLMVIQFKQGFGRLLRRESDRGAVILYDKRVARKSYLPELLGALPGFQPRDLVAERSRRHFYALLAARLPGLIDPQIASDILADLPDVLSTDIEALVKRLAIPDPLPDAAYDTWRPQIVEAMQALYGHGEFRSPAQEAALRAMLTGTDLLAVLPTGAGKSLCFQLPALLRPGLTVVCSPLIALMRDQIEKLQDRNIEIAAALMSGQSAAEREEILERARTGRLRLLYLAPERLRDPVVRAVLAAAPLRQMVVDEAHCVALWGPSFRPDFLVLPQIYGALPHRPPVAAFTATATPMITGEIIAGLALQNPALVRAPIDRPELRLVVLDRQSPWHAIASKRDKLRRLLMLVQTADERGETMLIYTATTVEAEYLARMLQVAGYTCRAYHGRMPIQERANVSELFMEGLISIVVCTRAFGMGIDKPDIRYVVHYHVPGDLESYFQEVGRAGRDGQVAYGVLLYLPSDERIQHFFMEQSRPDGELLARLWAVIASHPERWVLDPGETCEQLEIDELELRRGVYLLERAGLIRRGADTTLRGNLTLLGRWDEVLVSAPPEHISLLQRVSAALPQVEWRSVQMVLSDLAAEVDAAAEELERALITLASAGLCLYRPWERGYQLTRIAPPGTPVPSVGTDIVSAQEQKLDQMRAFVRSDECRWQRMRRYFGDAPGEPCGQCDRCTPQQAYPWSHKTGRDVPDVSDFVDLPTLLLEVAAWNERRASDGRAPYSATSLARILRGDEFALMRYTPPGLAAQRRREELRTAPGWGVCRTLQSSTAQINAILERLVAEQYLERRTAPIGADGNYAYLVVTETGRTHLQSGTRLNWSNQ